MRRRIATGVEVGGLGGGGGLGLGGLGVGGAWGWGGLGLGGLEVGGLGVGGGGGARGALTSQLRSSSSSAFRRWLKKGLLPLLQRCRPPRRP